jgi:T5SS/PEP-CTERM-associated repeat protein
MSEYQWNAAAGATADFGVPHNWLVLGLLPVVPPGVNDNATIETAGAIVAGVGTVAFLSFLDVQAVEGQLTGLLAIRVRADMRLLPGAVLTTSLLNIALKTNDVGTVVVGKHGSVVINGDHPANSYAIFVGQGAGANGKLRVHGEGAVVSGGGEPIVIGHKGHGVLRISQGGTVTAGNADPYLFPFAMVIGNRNGSNGKVKISRALLSATGEIVVGRAGQGELEVKAAGTVSADTMEIGLSTGATGLVKVVGERTCLLLASTLTVGVAGVGSLAVEDHGRVTANFGIRVNGHLSLADGLVETGSLVVNAGGFLAGHGKVIAAAGFSNAGTITVHHRLTLVGDISNNGTIEVDSAGANLQCVGAFGAANDTGSLLLGADGIASLDAVTAGQTITFTSDGTLKLHSPEAFDGAIAGFSPGNIIELDAQPTGTPTFGGGTFTFIINGFTVGLKMSGALSTASFKITTLPGGGALISHT